MREIVSVSPWRGSDKLKVTLSDGSYFYAKSQSEAAATLAEGMEIDDEALAAWRAHGGLTAREAAGLLLGRRSYSERELADKLTEKGFTGEETAEAVLKMVDYGLVNDREYAEELVRIGLARGYSKRKILETLRNHGIDRDMARELTDGITDQRQTVRELVSRKYGDITGFDKKEMAKVIRHLQQCGFEWRDISAVVKGIED